MAEFHQLCERWWRDWLAEKIELAPEIKKRFDTDAMPEPYLEFDEQTDPLIILTTNPGGTMWHQERPAIQAGNGPVVSSDSYRTAARKLANFYSTELKGPAGSRIKAQLEIAKELGHDGVMQIECCPWHSASLPDKKRLPKIFSEDSQLAEYIRCLKTFIKDKRAIALSATDATSSLGPTKTHSQWTLFLADILGLNLDDTTFVRLVTKGQKVTSAAFVQGAGRASSRTIILMQGGNNFPGTSGRKLLVTALQP